MSIKEIEESISSFVNEELVDEKHAIQPNDQFNDVGIDSHAIIQIVLFVERNYSIQWTESDLNKKNLSSIASLAEFVYDRK